MKGLLLKDFYMIRKYCIFYLIIIFGLGFLTVFSSNTSMGAFPCLLAGMLPTTIHAYDEKEKWTKYSGALPYTKIQLVSVKYIYSLILGGITILWLDLVGTVAVLYQTGSLPTLGHLAFWTSLYMLVCAFISLCMPFIFKLGVEKGRFVYMIIGGICGVTSVFFVNANDILNLNGAHQIGNSPNVFGVFIMTVLAVAAFAISWILSIAMYQKRDIY